LDNLALAIRDYILRNGTDYAVMLEGKWGTGKTTFYIKKVEEWLRQQDGYDSIYVSLYGVSSIDQLTRKILVARWMPSVLDKFGNSKTGQIVTELGMALFATMTNFDPNLKMAKKISSINLDPRKLLFFSDRTVICLDDLERTKVDIEELFGFINGFVERDKLKVLFIANEEDILNEQTRERYEKIKEKMIRFTVRFPSQVSTVISNFIDGMPSHDREFKTFLKEKCDLINQFCEAAAVSNLRILKQAIDIYDALWNVIDDKTIMTDDRRLALFRFVISVVNEYMTSQTEIAQFINHRDDHSFKVVYHMAKNRTSDELAPIVKYVNKYFASDNEYIFSPSIINYVLNGYIDKSALNDELSNAYGSKAYKSPEDKLMYVPLYKSSNDEFRSNVDAVLDKLRNGNYSIYFYVLIFPSMTNFSRVGLLNLELQELKSIFVSGMELARDKSPYADSNPFMEMQLSGNAQGLNGDELEAYHEIRTLMNHYRKQIKAAHVKSIYLSVAEMIPVDFDEFCRQIGNSQNGLPILQHMDVDLLMGRLLSGTNVEIMLFTAFLKERYKYIHSTPDLIDEYHILCTLQEKVRPNISIIKPMQVSDFFLQELVNAIDGITSRMGTVDQNESIE